MSDLISRQAAIDALHMHLMYRMGTDSNKKRLDEWINNLPSAQPEQRSDMVSRADMLETYADLYVEFDDNKEICKILHKTYEKLRTLPSAQPEDWMERNKERILQAGMEGREIEFRIGGRLFAIREKAQ